SSEAAFRSIEHTIVTHDSTVQVPLASGKYYYRATALDSGGLESNPDLTRNVTVIDSSVFIFTLQITNPSTREATVETETYDVAGIARGAEHLLIENAEVTVGSNGSFHHLVAVTGDKNIIRLTATHRDGRTLSDSVILRTPRQANLDAVFRFSPYNKLFGYNQYNHGFLFGVGGEYQLNRTQAAGFLVTFGSNTNVNSTPPPGGTPGNSSMVILQITGRNDFDVNKNFLFSGDLGVGPILWSGSPGNQQTSFALGAGLDAKIMDGSNGYMLGARGQFIPFDQQRFDPLSASQPHFMIAFELALIFNDL
ncbi:MAG TPA: hypothetical protein VKS81_11610, partial [Bacteroidota bacterium]|nr:hypothetical protein [Bacteroidota bacterium]